MAGVFRTTGHLGLAALGTAFVTTILLLATAADFGAATGLAGLVDAADGRPFGSLIGVLAGLGNAGLAGGAAADASGAETGSIISTGACVACGASGTRADFAGNMMGVVCAASGSVVSVWTGSTDSA